MVWASPRADSCNLGYKTYNYFNSEQCGYSLPKLVAKFVYASVAVITCIHAMLLLLL